jgi:hypothetical protein
VSEIKTYPLFCALAEGFRKKISDLIQPLRSGKRKKKPLRKFGILKGQIHMSEDFDAPLEEFKEYM